MAEEKVKPSSEVKEEYQKLRAEEIKRYNEELVEFLRERNIDLDVRFIADSKGNRTEIFIIDTQ